MSKNKNWQQKQVRPTVIENTAVQVPEEHQPLEKETAADYFIGTDPATMKATVFNDQLQPVEEIDLDQMAFVPKDGTRIYLAEEPGDNFVLGYWKKTRSVTRENRFKWLVGGKWVNAFGQNLGFEPQYWKEA